LQSNQNVADINPCGSRKETSQSREKIQTPRISKQTAGAVAGAAIGSIAGPIGVIVGGVADALAGSATLKRRHVVPSSKKTSRRGDARKRAANRVRISKSRNTMAPRASSSLRASHNRKGNKKKALAFLSSPLLLGLNHERDNRERSEAGVIIRIVGSNCG